MNDLTLCNTLIRRDAEGRYCLNDLHRAAGAEVKHKPANWLQSQQTSDLIAELQNDGIPSINKMVGRTGGTYVCKELVYAYAMWISSLFHLKVIRAYDALVTAPTPPPLYQIPQTRAEALRLAADLEEQNAKLVTQIEQNKPKVDFFDKVVDAENTLPVGDVAKILGTGEHRLFKLLRDERLMNKENIPYQRYLDTGLFLVKTTIHQFEDRGRQIVNRTPVVTGKGLAYLQNKYFPVGSRQLSLLHKNPNPPGSIKPGSTTDRVLKLLTDHPRKTYSESEIMREIRSTHGSVSFALVQLRHFGAITAIPSEQNDRYFLYRIKNEALAA